MVRESVLVRGTDKGYIEYLKKDNYVTVLFIVEINTYIVPNNQCCQVPIVEGTGLWSGNLCNIYSSPNKNTLLIISSKIIQDEEEE